MALLMLLIFIWWTHSMQAQPSHFAKINSLKPSTVVTIRTIFLTFKNTEFFPHQCVKAYEFRMTLTKQQLFP